ncbi:MAG: OPT family oligopeptide transporter [Myxococcales bacterium]|nr:OPT family oligopeptide transporter [Myxococcales bacterium]
MSEESDQVEESKQVEGQLYTPKPGEAQLTPRAVILGCFIGGLVSAMNISFGLKIGWTVGGSLMAAILGYAAFSIFTSKDPTVLETNICQTTGSAAGTMASAGGLVAPIPAMFLLGNEIPLWGMFAWVTSVAFLGVFFAVPLRKQYVEIEKLRFPTGTATANTIVSMFATGATALAQARVLVWIAIVAGAYSLASFFIPYMEAVPTAMIGGVFATAAAWQFKLYLGPMLFGAGFLIGPRVAISLLLGAIVSWGILAPLSLHQGWVDGPIMSLATGPRGWILWPGVAIMLADALMSLALAWKTISRTFRFTKDEGPVDPEAIPNQWWIAGLAAGTVLVSVMALLLFDIPIYMSLIAVALSAILAAIAVRSTGETDINPVGGMGKVTQLVFGGVSPGSISTNLMAASISGAGASQAGDMMQDLKTGHLLGSSPRKQLLAQLMGIPAGCFFAVLIFYLFKSQYEFGGTEYPAPAAFAWKAVAELMAQGFSALPTNAVWGMVFGGLFGMAMPLCKKFFPKSAPYLPSGLAFGIAFIVQAFYSITMFLGLLVYLFWKKRKPKAAEVFVFAVASGLIAGEGLMNIVKGLLSMAGVEPLI